MRRPMVLQRVQLVRLMMAVLLGTLGVGVSLGPAVSAAQDEPTAPLVDVTLDPMPLAPSFVRLIRITLESGSSIPMRSHPGPKIDRVEAGTLTATVRDENNVAAVSIGGADETGVEAGKDVAIGAGDVIVLPADTFYAFRNDGDVPVVLLSSILLPAGHQRPPGITYADGEPAANAYDGVTNQILGDGVATALPTAPGRFVIDRVTVTPDQPLAASEDVTLLSNIANGVDITVDGGRVQVSRTVTPGPQRDSAVDSAYTLIGGDGIFFPEGHADITVPEGELSFIRLTLTGGPSVASGATTGDIGTPAAAGTPAVSGAGAITVVLVPSDTTGSNATPLPMSSRPPREQATEAPPRPTAAPTATPGATSRPTVEATAAADSGTASDFPLGATVETVDVGVNVRAAAASDAEVVLVVDAAGTRFVVIGQPVDAGDFTWIEVQSVDDPSVSGWIAADFLQIV
jgi:quercetin dioxygenase-like cupin family protein